jgi:2,4-dienoyl-CoA reductase-like NADH-dependent reductase (Old Yellow Enzyme family)
MVDNSKLFEKYTLNNKVEVPNLLAVAPLTLFGSNPDGSVSEEEREYLKRRATGIGLYILGATAVSQEGIAFAFQPRALSDKDIQPNAERAKIIKDQGALAINQIHHGGCHANKTYSGVPVMVVSVEAANKELKDKGMFTEENKFVELTDKDIKRIINDFARATEISLKAGYDGIEIHGANNFILQQFYSGFYNKRKDEWGGSLEKRMRFPLEVVDACCKIRDKYNKPEFIIGYRLSPEEPFEDGITMTETLALVRELVKKPIQFIHVSETDYFREARRGEGKGTPRLKLIHEITKGKMALIGVGGLNTDKDFNKALNSGYSDFFGTGRASMLNKDLGILLKEGKTDKLEVTLDPNHPEKYSFPKILWDMCVKGTEDWLPHVQKK